VPNKEEEEEEDDDDDDEIQTTMVTVPFHSVFGILSFTIAVPNWLAA
jgi:hypothetical protein